MKPSVYLETTIIGYLAMRPSRDIITAARQQITAKWWQNHRANYDLFVSLPVVQECGAGDQVAAEERLVFIADIPLLDVTAAAEELANQLIANVPMPPRAQVDALHLAIAAVHEVDYLLTWNCTHLANPSLIRRIETTCKRFGVEPPILCTAQQLLGEFDDPMQEESDAP
jgi:hypothetical protein